MAKASVTITANDQLTPGLLQAKKSLMQFEQQTKKIGDTLSKVFNVTAIVLGLGKLTSELSKCVSEYTEAEKVSKRLIAVWENVGSATGKSAREVDDYAEALEKVTYFSSESIKEAALLLASTESLNQEGFEKTLELSADLAAALGEDIPSAAQTLAKAMVAPDEGFKSLKKVGIAFTDSEKDQIKTLIEANKLYEAQDMILGKVEERYQGVAEAINATPSGKLDAIKDTLGDIRESLGRGIMDALDPAFTFILTMLQKISNWAKDHLDQKEFWANAATSTPHSLYSNYSEAFLTERQTESMEMLAEQLNLMRTNPWGSLLEEKFGQNLTDILQQNSGRVMDVAIKAAIEKYGPNYSDIIGSYEGFADIIAEQYNPLVSQLNNINGALDEYVNAVTVETPGVGGVGGTSVTVTNALMDFLGKYGNSSSDYQKAQYEKIIQEASALMGQFYTNGILDMEWLKEWGGISSEQEALAIYNQLGQVVETYSAKIADLTKNNETIEPTELEQILSKYGKSSSAYQIKLINDEIDSVMAQYENASAEEQTYLNQIVGNLIEQRYAIEKGNEIAEEANSNIIELVKNPQLEAFGSGVLNSFTSNLGKAGDQFNKLTSNMASMGTKLGILMTVLDPIIRGLGEELSPILDQITDTVLLPLIEVGKAVGSVIAPILEALAPILQTLGTGIVVVAGVFEWVGQLLRHWAASFVNAFTWLTGYRMSDPGSPGNIVDFVNNKVDAYHNATNGVSGTDGATQTAISQASYRGATSVTINIYQEAPVVGDNGMRQFAQMIRDEFEALDYYGVSA